MSVEVVGIPGQVHKLAQKPRGIRPGIDNAAARVENRPLGVRDQIHRLPDALGIALDLRAIRLVHDLAGSYVGPLCELDVLRNVDNDRAGPSVLGDEKRLMQDTREVVHILHKVIVFRAGPRDADRVALLEGVGADQRRRNLPRYADDRDRIHQRVGEPCHRVRRARAGRNKHHAHLAAGPRISLRRVNRALLVTHEEVLDPGLLENLVVDRKNGAAGISENVLNALIGEGL